MATNLAAWRPKDTSATEATSNSVPHDDLEYLVKWHEKLKKKKKTPTKDIKRPRVSAPKGLSA